MKKKWQKKYLYSQLISAIPLVARLTPESLYIFDCIGIKQISEECNWVKFSLPMQLDELPDGEFDFTISSKRFVNLFSDDTPANHFIMQTRIIGRYFFVNTVRVPHGLYRENEKLGILQEGDFKLEITDKLESHIYFVKVNNRQQSASLLYAINSLTGQILTEQQDDFLKKFLKKQQGNEKHR